MPNDWRPPTDNDWRRLRTLLRDVLVHLEGDADLFDTAEQDLRTVGGDTWSIGIERYPDRAEMCRVLASWVEDEYRAARGWQLSAPGRARRPRHVPGHAGTLMRLDSTR